MDAEATVGEQRARSDDSFPDRRDRIDELSGRYDRGPPDDGRPSAIADGVLDARPVTYVALTTTTLPVAGTTRRAIPRLLVLAV
jgi:hypothetical protein